MEAHQGMRFGAFGMNGSVCKCGACCGSLTRAPLLLEWRASVNEMGVEGRAQGVEAHFPPYSLMILYIASAEGASSRAWRNSFLWRSLAILASVCKCFWNWPCG